jgi:hypothetical protein
LPDLRWHSLGLVVAAFAVLILAVADLIQLISAAAALAS